MPFQPWKLHIRNFLVVVVSDADDSLHSVQPEDSVLKDLFAKFHHQGWRTRVKGVLLIKLRPWRCSSVTCACGLQCVCCWLALSGWRGLWLPIGWEEMGWGEGWGGGFHPGWHGTVLTRQDKVWGRDSRGSERCFLLCTRSEGLFLFCFFNQACKQVQVRQKACPGSKQ